MTPVCVCPVATGDPICPQHPGRHRNRGHGIQENGYTAEGQIAYTITPAAPTVRVAPIDRFLGGCSDWRCTRDPDAWRAICPAHTDSTPSLVIRRNPDGMVWFKCWAGCEKEAILDALGLTWRDCYEDSEHDHTRANYVYARRGLGRDLRRELERLLKWDERLAA